MLNEINCVFDYLFYMAINFHWWMLFNNGNLIKRYENDLIYYLWVLVNNIFVNSIHKIKKIFIACPFSINIPTHIFLAFGLLRHRIIALIFFH